MHDRDAIIIGGGQSGLAMTRALQDLGRTPLLLEAGPEPVGSWPRYYDSLVLFSPARYSALPGRPFPGDPRHYPHRDEVIDYLRDYAADLRADIRTRHRVAAVHRAGRDFTVEVDDGQIFTAPIVIAATGGFGNPHQPALQGLDTFTGTLLHARAYREPSAFAGQRIVVVGGGNTAVQVAVELAHHAQVTLASRAPVRFLAQRPLGRDLHAWIAGIDALPIGHLVRTPPTQPVFDSGTYRKAITTGHPDRRELFTAVDGDKVCWTDGTREHVDTLILATGYRPDVGYLAPLGALDPHGHPRQSRGLSTSHAGLGYLGLEWQRSPASASLRGVGRDARYLARRLLSETR
jgi:putative flavoprotein involved in K+ transport